MYESIYCEWEGKAVRDYKPRAEPSSLLFLALLYSLVFIGNVGDDPSQLVRVAAVVRGVESAGQSVSYGINSTSLRLDVVAGINAAQWLLALLPAYLVIKKIGITKDGTYIFEPAIYAPPEVRDQLKAQGVKGAVAVADDEKEWNRLEE